MTLFVPPTSLHLRNLLCIIFEASKSEYKESYPAPPKVYSYLPHCMNSNYKEYISYKTKMKKSNKVVLSSMIGLHGATRKECSRFSKKIIYRYQTLIFTCINLNYLARNSCRNMVRFWVNLSLFLESMLRATSAMSLSKHEESRWCWCWSIGCKN